MAKQSLKEPDATLESTKFYAMLKARWGVHLVLSPRVYTNIAHRDYRLRSYTHCWPECIEK